MQNMKDKIIVVSTLAVCISLNAWTLFGAPSVSVDSDRPMIGVPLVATINEEGALTGAVVVKWYRGDASGNYNAAPIAEGLSYSPTEADCEHWIKVSAADDGGVFSTASIFFSRMPVFYMTTEDGSEPTYKKEEHSGTLRAQGNGEFKMLYDGAFTIKVRGNSTSKLPKKPYKIKLDKKTDMFGFGKSKHWVLLANYYDESLMRNKLAYDFARDIGVLGMKSTWVDCVLNGTYIGCYQFCEHLRVDAARVNVYNWEDAAESVAGKFAKSFGLSSDEEDELVALLQTNLLWVTSDSVTYKDKTANPSELWDKYSSDITGGYFFEFSSEYDEISKFTTESGVLALKTMVSAPEYLCTNDEMFQYCQDYLQQYWDACTSPDGYAAGRHYSELADLDSMLNYWLVMEMFGNDDARAKSRFAYKDQGGKLVFGPAWDFDWGVGGPVLRAQVTNETGQILYYKPVNSKGWKSSGGAAHVQSGFYKEWSDDPYFCTRLYERYWQVRDRFAEIVAPDGLIDQYEDLLAEAGAANEGKWKFRIGFSGDDGDVQGLKTYLSGRLSWLDQQFSSVSTLVNSFKSLASSSPYSADDSLLPLAFANTVTANSTPETTVKHKLVFDGQHLHMLFSVADANVDRIDVTVNGIKTESGLLLADGAADLVIPSETLVAGGRLNCIQCYAYNAGGALLGRNFALVTVSDWDDAATEAFTSEDGTVVPSVPLEWIRDAAKKVMPELQYADSVAFANAVVMVPSPWGKSRALWTDYVAGTNPDPTATNAEFVASIKMSNGSPVVTWFPDLKEARRYVIEGRASLSPLDDWHSPTNSLDRFFRVSVQLP